MEDAGIFYGHLVPFTNIWYMSGKFYGHLVYFPGFGMLYQDKSGNPGNGRAALSFGEITFE
jgi:hypothetical protein